MNTLKKGKADVFSCDGSGNWRFYYQSFGNPPFDATINIQFGDYPPLVYSIDNFGLTQSSGFFSGVDRVVIGSSGMILNCNNDSFGSNLFFRLVVSHE